MEVTPVPPLAEASVPLVILEALIGGRSLALRLAPLITWPWALVVTLA